MAITNRFPSALVAIFPFPFNKAEIAHWKAKASQKIKSPHYPRTPDASPLGLKETERTDTRVNI